MKAIKYEEKFIVVNLKHLGKVPPFYSGCILWAFDLLKRWLPNHKYYVCNQDEPYAQKIIDIILEGEFEKQDQKNDK